MFWPLPPGHDQVTSK